MNFTTAYILFSFAIMASAHVGMKSARRLDQSIPTDLDDDFLLIDYQIKMISCISGYATSIDHLPSHGAVIFRFCPSNSGCSNIRGMSCDSGYGEYIIHINTFVKSYLKQLVNNETDDDFFNSIQQLGECRQYKPHDFFIGPTCSTFGTGIRMALFSDAECSDLEKSVKFEDISKGGISLPYSNGGLISDSCESCAMKNQYGFGEKYEVETELCSELRQLAYEKCESKMIDFNSTSTEDIDSCEFIHEMLYPWQSSPTRVVVPVVVSLCVVIGIAILFCVVHFVRKARRGKTQEMLQPLTVNPTPIENETEDRHHEGKQSQDNDLVLRVIT